jgi:hypothetical protein
MKRWHIFATLLVALVVTLAPMAEVKAGGIHFGINIGIPLPPPPPVVTITVPQLVVVPGTAVYYAPDVSHNIFFYDNRYYIFHHDAWFSAASHNGPWTFIVHEKVPASLLAVPVQYYKVAPGHAKDKEELPPRARRDEGHSDYKHQGKHKGKHDN